MKILHVICVLFVASMTLGICAQRRMKNADILADLKKRGERFLQELNITADDYKVKIKEFKKNNPHKAEILENIRSRIELLKTKNETIDLDDAFEELKSYIKPEHLKEAKIKLIEIRTHINDINRTAFYDLKEWSESLVHDSELWM
jgi:hypothetical protein